MIKFLLIITSWWFSLAEQPNPNGHLWDYAYGAGFEANRGRLRAEATLQRADENYYNGYELAIIPYKKKLLSVHGKMFRDDLKEINYQNLALRFGSIIYTSANLRTLEWEDPTWIVRGDRGSQFICQTLHGNDKANAHLIAAAPIMADYIEYVEAKIDIDEMPMTFNEWKQIEAEGK